MMNLKQKYRLLCMVATMIVLVPVTGWAQKKKEANQEAEQICSIVEDVGLAAQLAAYGRGELNEVTGLKDFKSAEALVAAGGLTLRLHKETAGQVKLSKATVKEDDKDVPAEGAAPSFEADAEALFDEARAMATDKAAVEALIKEAKAITARGAVGGPQVINRTVKSGKTHTLHVEFEPNSRAVVAMRGTGTTQFEVVGPNGKVLWHSKGSFGTYQWHTGRGGNKDVTIKVVNRGGPPVSYNVTTN